MSLNLLVAAVALAGALDQPLDAAPAPSSVRLAQGSEVEDFGDAPPLPPPPDEDAPLEPVGEAPPLPPPTLDDGTDAAAPAPAIDDDEDAPTRADAAEGESSPLLTRALQYGAGLGTLTLCTGASCLGLACASPVLVSCFQPFAFTLPLLGPCVSAAILTGLGAGGGATAGAVEGFVGDAFGSEDGGVLWPTLAAAGTGAGLLALFAGAALASQLSTARYFGQDPLALRFDSPLGCLFASSAVVAFGAYLLATPLVGALVYGSVATPKAPEPAASARIAAPARMAQIADDTRPPAIAY